MSDKEDVRAKLLEIVKQIPDDEELILGFNLSKLTTAESIITKKEKEDLIAKIQSAKMTKTAMMRTLAMLAGIIKVAILLK
ncbi:MAG TPA: hypothetical protein VMW10_04260 [Alphaproteobacteria bacterium]|nr:hypothetical protein [Alphaproteobacteria bacterium]